MYWSDLGPWAINFLDGISKVYHIPPGWLEPVDVPNDPPNAEPSSSALPLENEPTSGPLKSILGSITRKRRQTVNGAPPPYLLTGKECPDK